MKSFEIEERIESAIENFESGFNCAQSVFLAYSDIFDLDLDTARNMSVSFGGGVGRMREMCGTISAMAMLVGFKYPVLHPENQEERARNYAMVQKVANLFKEKYGSVICRNLLPEEEANKTSPVPSVRTGKYYSTRPCSKYVEEAARIAGQMLNGDFD